METFLGLHQKRRNEHSKFKEKSGALLISQHSCPRSFHPNKECSSRKRGKTMQTIFKPGALFAQPQKWINQKRNNSAPQPGHAQRKRHPGENYSLKTFMVRDPLSN
ncbi:hypothetical protein CDAR_108761 [Caerostris darwini]|uniref:Uncharacterized protein n=1 Tax=Caerostris darwini TaxID=1538125 RepID=A0AAV4V5V5_9ARAC|nr:hypothetical protein CDAR_108761 [Caerostris darwini]